MRWSRYPKLESRNEVAGAPLITRRRAPSRCTQANSRHNGFRLKRLVIELRMGTAVTRPEPSAILGVHDNLPSR
jgi:hypothetical protein